MHGMLLRARLSTRVRFVKREIMLAPDEVATMVRLHRLGWGTKRIAGELGCSRNTVKRYLAAGKDERGVGYVKGNAIAGHVFGLEVIKPDNSFEELSTGLF